MPYLLFLKMQQNFKLSSAANYRVKIDCFLQTSTAMLWTMYCLAKNPDIQEKLYNETQKALGENGEITADNISKLTYVKAVLKETFRYILNNTVINKRKPVFRGLRTSKGQTSLRISAVGSAHLLFPYWKVSYLNLLQGLFKYECK